MDGVKKIGTDFLVFWTEKRVSAMPLTHKPLRDVIGELIKYVKQHPWQNKTMKEVSILSSFWWN